MSPDNKIVFPFPGNQSYQFEIKETDEIYSTTGEVQNRDAFNTHVNLIYRPLAAHKVLVQFNTAIKSTDIQGAVRDEDMIDPLYEGFKGLQGAIFNVTLTPHGEVVGISGYEDFARKFKSLYNTAEAADKDAPKQTSPVTPVIEKAFFLDIFNQISNTLEGKAISVGSTWESMVAEEIGAEKDIKNMYKCDKIENAIAYISSTNDHIENQIKGHNITIVLKGSMQGEYELDAATGILIRGKRCLIISGSTKSMYGTDFEMTVKKTITINSKQINDTDNGN